MPLVVAHTTIQDDVEGDALATNVKDRLLSLSMRVATQALTWQVRDARIDVT